MWTNTLFPFLYQTRTLRYSLRGALDAVLSRQLTHAATLRSQTVAPNWQGRGQADSPRHDETLAGRGREKLEHHPVPANRARASFRENAGGYDEEAAGYDQKDAGGDKKEVVPHKRAQRNISRNVWHKAPKHDKDVPFELPSDLSVQEEAEQVEVDDPKSTITPTEKQTFETIFEEIRERKQSSAREAPNEGGARRDGLHDSLFEPQYDHFSQPEPASAQTTVNIIIKDAAVRTSRKARSKKQVPFEPLHAIGQTANAFDRQTALLRFPPSLRRAARTAVNVFSPDVNKVTQAAGTRTDMDASGRPANEVDGPSETSTGMVWGDFGEEDANSEFVRVDPTVLIDPLGQTIVCELARAEERRRVEAALKEAKNDFHLWDLLEEHVFSMVDKLGISQDKMDTEAAKEGEKHGKLGKRGKIAKPTKPQGTQMDIKLHGPLYPGYLLFALRMMDRHFSRSSPLALAILPRVKELGMSSYLLGASTSFYNVLMELHWRRYNDAQAVLNLLEEMNYAGLYLDGNTKSLVHRMERDFWWYSGRPTDRREHNERIAAEKHPFLFELMQTPDYDVAIASRLRHWAKTAEISIMQRKRAMREQLESQDDDIPMEGAGDEEGADREVEY